MGVLTFESDSNALEMTDYNPWSRELYLNRKIKLTIGDVARGVEMFSTGFFSSIIHVLPPFTLSPVLYSLDLYKNIFRFFAQKGMLFHPTGDAEREQREVSKGIAKRLKEAGFRNVVERPDILGVTAQK